MPPLAGGVAVPPLFVAGVVGVVWVGADAPPLLGAVVVGVVVWPEVPVAPVAPVVAVDVFDVAPLASVSASEGGSATGVVFGIWSVGVEPPPQAVRPAGASRQQQTRRTERITAGD